MSTLRSIRLRLGMSQEELGKRIGVRQCSISHYECARYPIPIDVARQIIRLASTNGILVTFDEIYAHEDHQPKTNEMQAA